MNKRIKLTKTTVRALQPGPSEYLVWDCDLSRFGVRVKPSGAKTYVVQYRTDGRQRRRKIGSAKIISADAARDQARRYLADVELNNDPAARKDKLSSDPLFRDFCTQYLKDYAEHHVKKRTQKEYRNLINQVIQPALGRRRL